jgi:hypothetical protein
MNMEQYASPPPAVPHKRKRLHVEVPDEVRTCTVYGVCSSSSNPTIDKAHFLTGVNAFLGEFGIHTYCIGGNERSISVFIRFKKAVNVDNVLGLCKTISPTVHFNILPLKTKTLRRNWLSAIYKDDSSPFETLEMQEKLTVPFELLLPAWLLKQTNAQIDLSDGFLINYANYYPYIAARVMNQSYTYSD